jgi:Fe-S-cluster-containing dehydrogenase component
MAPTRREFLKIIVLSAAGLACQAACPALARAEAVKTGKDAFPSPLKAKRWGMVVYAERCPHDCTDCVAACHRVHNVPDFGNPKDEIKWIDLQPPEKIFPEQSNSYSRMRKDPLLPVLCNHCDNPPCVRVCPTQATFKREDGITMMDFHRCIGCRYCMAGCPYGARSFNFRDPRDYIKTELNTAFPTRERGVVEKCNFCEERLALGQAPACVGACPDKALVFGDLNDPASGPSRLLADRFAIRRRAELGTGPQVYYIV